MKYLAILVFLALAVPPVFGPILAGVLVLVIPIAIFYVIGKLIGEM